MRRFNNNSGFSLVELSIVLVIIGLLVGLGSSMIGPMMNLTKVRETRDMQDASIQSIVSWAASRNMLPDATSGDNSFSKIAKNTKDAWNQDFLYLYDSSLSPTTSPTKDTICGRRSTSLKLDPGTGTVLNDVAFVIISRADNPQNNTFKSKFNGTLGTDLSHTNDDFINVLQPSGVTPSGYALGTITSSGTNPDLIRWVTLDELRGKIGCQGAPLKIVNNELPFGSYSTSYSAMVVADGGSGAGNYQWRIKKGTFPAGLTATALPFLNSSTTGWVSAPSMYIQGHPKPQGSYVFSIFVQDSIGNNSSKSFVLSVNPN